MGAVGMKLDLDRLVKRSLLFAVPGLWTVVFLLGCLGAFTERGLSEFGDHEPPWPVKCLMHVWVHRSLRGLAHDVFWWFVLAQFFMQIDGTRTKIRVLSTAVLGSGAGFVVWNLVAPDAPGAGGWLFVVSMLGSLSGVIRGGTRFNEDKKQLVLYAMLVFFAILLYLTIVPPKDQGIWSFLVAMYCCLAMGKAAPFVLGLSGIVLSLYLSTQVLAEVPGALILGLMGLGMPVRLAGPVALAHGGTLWALVALGVLDSAGTDALVAGAVLAQAVAFTVGLVHGLCERLAQNRAARVA